MVHIKYANFIFKATAMSKTIYSIIIWFALSFSYCYGQDISGKWIGRYEDANAVATSLEELEVNISLTGDTIKGTSYLQFGRGIGYQKYGLNGIYNKKDKTVYFSEDEEIEIHTYKNISIPGSYNLTLSTDGSKMRLEGYWETDNIRHYGFPMRSVVWLEKVIPEKAVTIAPDTTTHVTYTKYRNASTRNLTNSEKLARNTNIQKTIELDSNESDNILIEFSDNVRIDNDIISVFINEGRVINQQTLSEIPIPIRISLSDKDVVVLKVAADSYGAMPPCTTQMTVTTNKHKYVVDLSSTFTSNAAVKFVLK